MRPFSDGSQYGDWQASNCDRCTKSIVNGGECELETALMEAYYGDGEVIQEIADRISYTSETDIWMCGEVSWCGWWKKEVLMRRQLYGEL